MPVDPDVTAPLASRLRAAASVKWFKGEPIALLLEAADAIEYLAARVAELEYERRPRPDYDPRIDYPERYTDGPI